ncbi:hypothetical protein AFR_00670 [Actinoplanes friuliensis DSM 7358]|uniref:Uncharacterized protein n=1 Tax=Actinoplanes friuliensis DSM 7358 TaxID=1246995 RepID=U5VN73_9ACTN|nr:hypothetical protein AFR_00670 [Actinoplanes friuliensis DSM 7358]
MSGTAGAGRGVELVVSGPVRCSGTGRPSPWPVAGRCGGWDHGESDVAVVPCSALLTGAVAPSEVVGETWADPVK